MMDEFIHWPKPYLLLLVTLLLVLPSPEGLLVCLRVCYMLCNAANAPSHLTLAKTKSWFQQTSLHTIDII